MFPLRLLVCLVLIFFLVSVCVAQINPRIIDGEVAPSGLYPYMASIVSKEKKNGYKHHCGASIINDQYVLTAAHCVGTGDYVLVGSQDITKRGGSTSLEISGFIIHPDFMYLMMEADIALLKVYGELGQPLVNLPEMSEEDPAIGKTHARVVGWGRSNERRKKKISKRLKHGQVNFISYEECESRFNQVKEVYDIGEAELPEHLICLQTDPLAQNTFESASPCNGDSGSPLLVNQDEELVQVGVASFILGDCGSRLLGSGYTAVHPYLEWIYRVISEGDTVIDAIGDFRLAIRSLLNNAQLKVIKKRRRSIKSSPNLAGAIANFELKTAALSSDLQNLPKNLFRNLDLVTQDEINLLAAKVINRSTRPFQTRRLRKKTIAEYDLEAVILFYFKNYF